jgi:hypothetical protein
VKLRAPVDARHLMRMLDLEGKEKRSKSSRAAR